MIVTGDVGVNEAAHLPFAEADTLEEAALWTPLVVRLPSGALAGKRVAEPTNGVDLARTALTALGLSPPSSFGGLDLVRVAGGELPTGGRPMLASVEGRFALRWDHYVVSGAKGRETKLCDLVLEPSCVTDVRPTYPLALDILHRALFDALVTAPRPPPREPAAIDAATGTALHEWGR